MPTATVKTHILIVDDDAQIRRMLRRMFEGEGYRVSEAASANEARALMTADGIDLVTLDLNLGGEDGLIVAKELRERSRVPIVMITGKSDMIDMVVGLELGADDYISKPFHLREVLARIRSVLRRSAGSEAATAGVEPAAGGRYSFDAWTLDLSTRELGRADGSRCDLTSGEFDLLALLVQRPGRVLTRDQIMDLMKGHDWNPNDRTIDNQVVRLRRKIEPDPKDPRIIKTVRGAGYTFAVPVTRI
jgi:DNA-binding response OmpR family regulator